MPLVSITPPRSPAPGLAADSVESSARARSRSPWYMPSKRPAPSGVSRSSGHSRSRHSPWARSRVASTPSALLSKSLTVTMPATASQASRTNAFCSRAS
eukprot:2893364-Prymnesium_polylepis.1